MELIKLFHSLSVAVALGICPVLSQAQGRVAIATNLVDYIDGGTLNMDASLSLSEHVTIGGAMRYNPYDDKSRQRTFSLGARWWPWYVYSGWWLSGNANYQEFSDTSSSLREGDRYGASFRMGYSHLISKHFNIDIGWGLWGGYEIYKEYGCGTCARIRQQGTNYFFAPDSFILSIAYIF